MVDQNLDGDAVLSEDLANRMDSISINDSTRMAVERTETKTLPTLSPPVTFNPLTVALWETCPKGIYQLNNRVKTEFWRPTIITENGVPDTNDDALAQRSRNQTLQWVQRARDQGATVGGYSYWTRIDNYQWNHGMSLRFGLFEVNLDDPTKPRPFVSLDATISERRGIPQRLAQQHPIAD